MRELKFRAWHHGGGDPRVKGYMAYSYPFPVLFWEAVEDEVLAVEVMQFTGLLDKNGKEIYEGDIVKNVFSDTYVDLIEFIQGVFCIAHDINEPLVSFHEDLIIIGNIHENPELMEA